jgi:hypothetical protein
MKPHIAQTIADLTAERERLQEIIVLLTNYGNATAEPANGTPKEQIETIHIPGGASNPPGADVTVYREITPRRKYTKREPSPLKPAIPIKQIGTETAAEARIESELDAPTTFGGAMKRVLREATNPITIATIWATIKTHWPDLLSGKDDGNIDANLRYWVSKGFADKMGAGQLATYKVIDSEFFKEVEA